MKKITSIIAASVITVSTALSVNSAAIYQTADPNDAEFLDSLGCTDVIDSKYWNILGYVDNSGENYYKAQNGHIVKTSPIKCGIEFTLPEKTDLAAFNEKLNGILGYDAAIADIPISSKELICTIADIAPTDAKFKAVCQALKACEEVSGMKYSDRVSVTHLYPSKFNFCTFFMPQLNEEQKSFIMDNSLDADVRFIDSDGNEVDSAAVPECFVQFCPKSGDTLNDELDIAMNLYEAVGLYPTSISPASAKTVDAAAIDISDYIDGDANTDGQLTIADAAAILQNLANGDKYPFTAQGAFNADIDGQGLSITDAAMVQKICVSQNK